MQYLLPSALVCGSSIFRTNMDRGFHVGQITQAILESQNSPLPNLLSTWPVPSAVVLCSVKHDLDGKEQPDIISDRRRS